MNKISGNRLDSLDQIRAIAILSVIISHYHSPWLPGGGVGVGVFFGLSGFLIASLLSEARPSLVGMMQFIIRRWFRVYPLFIASITVIFLSLPIAWPDKTHQFLESIPRLALMLGMPNAWFGYSVGVLWTLQIEFLFYVSTPLLILLLGKKRALSILPAALVATSLCSFFFPTELQKSNNFLFRYIYWGGALGIGAMLSLLMKSNTSSSNMIKKFVTDRAMSVAALSLAGIVILFFFEPSPIEAWHLQVFIAAICGCGLIIAYLCNSKLPVIGALVSIGRISYSMYLTHGLFLDYGSQVFHISVYGHFAKYIFVVIFLSYITYYAIERPGIKLGRIAGNTLLRTRTTVLELKP
jgi:peptidoglycan/LPS O-acetylase OafA/YrhL